MRYITEQCEPMPIYYYQWVYGSSHIKNSSILFGEMFPSDVAKWDLNHDFLKRQMWHMFPIDHIDTMW